MICTVKWTTNGGHETQTIVRRPNGLTIEAAQAWLEREGYDVSSVYAVDHMQG